jgi:hypothetical protein
LFSNIIMAIYPKSGTSGRGVSVGIAVGERVAAGRVGAAVNVAGGTADAMLGGADVVQAEIATNRGNQIINRNIWAFLRNRVSYRVWESNSCSLKHHEGTFAGLQAFGVL